MTVRRCAPADATTLRNAMPPAHKVTAQDVARACGVAVTTVYEIVGKSGHRYREETRAQVLAAAAALGYRPNAAARAMASGRFGMVGVIANAGGRTVSMRGDILVGIEEEAARLDCGVAIARLAVGPEGDAAPRLVREDLVDGYLVLPDLSLDQLRRVDVRKPMVFVNDRQPTDAVHPDDAGAGRRAVQRLLAGGARTLVYADFGRSRHVSAADRRDGSLEAMTAAGLPPRLYGPPPPDPAEDWTGHARTWLAGLERPVGLVTYSTATAIPILRAARDLGWTLPTDLRAITFGGPEVADCRHLPIAAWHVPQREMGAAAMQLLAARLSDGGASKPSVCVPYDPAWDMVPPEMKRVLG